jgi:monovalent cation:H+ antiporter-2, CPA2 family
MTDLPILTARATAAPVIIVGMGRIGRTVADALIQFDISYVGLERDQRRLREAIADGYVASFGDAADIRLWESLELHNRKLSVLTAPRLEVISNNHPIAAAQYPDLKRVAAVADDNEVEKYRSLGIMAIVERGAPHGTDVATAVLIELGCDAGKIAAWSRQLTERAPPIATVAPAPA